MEKFFQCFYCNQLIDNVYESECCGKLYCSNCISKLISKKCSLCQNNLFFQKNLFAQRMLKNIKIKCKYNCGKTLSYEEMKRHLLTCENKTYLCEFDHDDNNNNNIEFKGNKNEILEHLKTSHPIHLLIFMESYYMFKNTINKIIKCNKNDAENENEDETVLDFTNSNNNEIISRFSGNDILPVNYIVNEDSDEDLLDRHYAFVPRFNRRGNIRMRRRGNHRFVRNIEDTISFESVEYNNNNNFNNNIINNNNNIDNNINNNIDNNNIIINNNEINNNNNNNNNNINNIIDNKNNINNINESDFYD